MVRKIDRVIVLLAVIAAAHLESKASFAQCCQSKNDSPGAAPAVGSRLDPAKRIDAATIDLPQYFEQIGTDAALWYQHVQTLASPAFEGRQPGTDGIKRAADYIEFQFRSVGLLPPFASGIAENPKSFRQTLTLDGDATANPSLSTLTIGDESLVYGQDFVLAANTRKGSARGPVAFVGYAVEAGEGGYSSFDPSVDLRGKIAVVFRLEPLKDDGRFRGGDGPGPASSVISKLIAVAEKGASGVLIVAPPGAQYTVPELETIAGLGNSCDTIPVIPTAVITHAAAEKLLRKADPQSRDLMKWRRLADEGRVKTVALDDRVLVDLQANVETRTVVTENVAGALSGRGKLADEWLVIGAHYDHVGRGHARKSGDAGVLLGADDNASGTAMMLSLAGRLSRMYAEAAPDASLRSVLFVAFTAEETGLMGSRHFVKNPPVPLSSMYAMINFDAVGRLRDNKLWMYGSDSAPEFSGLLQATVAGGGLDVIAEPGGESSDHVSFLEAGVPALYFHTGPHEEYHTSADLAHTVNPAGAANVLDLSERVGSILASSPGELSFSEEAVKWSSWCAGTSSSSSNKSPKESKPCAPGCCKKPASATSPKSEKSKCCGDAPAKGGSVGSKVEGRVGT